MDNIINLWKKNSHTDFECLYHSILQFAGYFL